LDVLGKSDVNVVGWAGDGGTYDIGLQAISGAAERNDNAIYVCYDNEAYMNTGAQRSSATPAGAWTTTTPDGKTAKHPKKDIVTIMAAHRIPYIATLSVAFPGDFKAKMKHAMSATGFRFLLIQSPCPTGWRADAKDTVRIARLGVQSGLFPLVEVFGGREWKINHEPTFEGLDEYLSLQGRFRTLDDAQREATRDNIREDWKLLRSRVPDA
jgi:pyruvate/2-oxoacid:ferredoxin oxidoreductase beta subunit